jgi:regulator of protease activity HflC (stomatin/prohibitin superfamily)
MKMLEVLIAVFNVLTAWCPRFTKVPPTHRLVKWSKCGEGTEHGPGLIWYWPLVTETEEVDVRWVPSVTSVQSLTLADGESVSARVLVVWRVVDALHAIGENSDYSERCGDVAQSVVVGVIGKSLVEHLRHTEALNFAVTLEIRGELEKLGLEVDLCKFTELVVSPAFRVINDA